LTITEDAAAEAGAFASPGGPLASRSDAEDEPRAGASASAGRGLVGPILGWLLIFFGLAGVVGGLGMVYITSIISQTAAENARAQERLNPTGMPMAPPRQADVASQYLIAACSV